MFFNCSTTRFRWIQDSPEEAAPGWALDDIYVGESCPDMCHGRGHCKYGMCHCDEGYSGKLEPWGIMMFACILDSRATEILKSKSVRSTDDVIGTCVRQSQIVTKTNDSSFSSKSVSEIDYFSNTL